MLLGFALPVSGSWATPGNCAEVAATAEELGYASLWTFQRLLSPLEGEGQVLAPPYRSVYDPLAVLAFVAGRTTRARLGVAVVNAPYYAPVVLAKLLTTIDHPRTGASTSGWASGGCRRSSRPSASPPAGAAHGLRTSSAV
jgi:alkanesulfonate monooxygenase SsuD/methylene tetrahydromethanopterin reductase-like flavin-dependent oxidoreductase (luciferase family)